MDIRQLTPEFAVSPQILPEELEAIAAAGFKAIICNRPDGEVGPDLSSETLRAMAQAAGLEWGDNPISGGGMTMDNVVAQGALAETLAGPVLAYCRSGTRSATAWAFSMAGKMDVDDIIAATAKGGYDLAGARHQIENMAK